jgi:predicted class III extradiol MEMO1 family dioxygenase
MLRHPAVAGHFYQGSPDALGKQVAAFVVPVPEKKKALGVLSPHAGLIYSGPVAGAVYSSIELPDIFVLIGPNHTGLGAPVSIMTEGSWETPLGQAGIDEALATSILSKSRRIQEDALAHLREHSLEVQLPFIQHFKNTFTFVPIQMLDTRLETCVEVGRAVGAAIAECGIIRQDFDELSRVAHDGERSRTMRNAESKSEVRNPQSEIRNVLIVASSDMSHYERAATAKEKDFKAIQQIVDLNPEGLYHAVREYGITMCGYGPAVAMLVACKFLGATRAELVKYANSGEVSGDYDLVVGYAGIVVM